MAIWSNGKGEYTCGDCGHRWAARRRWLWWPVRLRWSWRTWGFGRHGVETGGDGIEQHVDVQVLSVGPLRIVLGSQRPAWLPPGRAALAAGSGEGET